MKDEILKHVCYTELVYDRINKKLKKNFTKEEIEKFIFDVLDKTNDECFFKNGKNIYVYSKKSGIKITINSKTFRIITVDII